MLRADQGRLRIVGPDRAAPQLRTVGHHGRQDETMLPGPVDALLPRPSRRRGGERGAHLVSVTAPCRGGDATLRRDWTVYIEWTFARGEHVPIRVCVSDPS
ncbi:hypothetical protein VTH06DRAFT_8595 [Thermothelomyces fergusii]